MTGSAYISPKKGARATKHEFIAEFSKKKSGVTKISERKAREPAPKPFRAGDEIEKAYLEMLEKQSVDIAKGGATFQQNIYDPSYDDCGGFGDGGFGDDTAMDLDDGYFGDNDGGDYEEEEESLESMSLYQVQENYKPVLKKEVFSRFEKKRSYKEKLKRYKENWTEFIDCVAGDLAWCPAGAQPCDCEDSVLLPALSWTGTKTYGQADVVLRMSYDAVHRM